MTDILKTYDTLPNKIFLWSIMRYVCLILKMFHGISIEIHIPRNSTEFYTYNSDRIWAKILSGLSPDKSHKTMLQKVFSGSHDNLKQHWYPILFQNNYLTKNYITIEVSYYLNKQHLLYATDAQKEGYEKILNQNKTVANILNYVSKIKSITKESSLYLLKYICRYEKLNNDLINKLYIYLTHPPTDPCHESENREDILVFLDDCF